MSSDLVSVVFDLVLAVQTAAENAKFNKGRAASLSVRVSALEPVLNKIRRAGKTALLERMRVVLLDAQYLLDKYADTGKFKELLKANKYKKCFAEIDAELLQLQVTISFEIMTGFALLKSDKQEDEDADVARHEAEREVVEYEGQEAKQPEDKRGMSLDELVHFGKIEVPASRIVVNTKKSLGTGGMGKVYSALMDGGVDVVVKGLNEVDAAAQRATRKELLVWNTLKSEFIIQLLGVTYLSPGVPSFIMPRCKYDLLQMVVDRGKPLPLLQQLDIALQVALGMSQLHAIDIIHHDLKPQNVLVTAKGNALLVDFGLARIAEDSSKRTGKSSKSMTSAGTIGFQPPEVINEEPCGWTQAGDMYSFGVLLCVLASGQPAWPGMTATQIMRAVMSGKKQVSVVVPKGHELMPMIEQCIAVEYDVRPTFVELAQKLKTMRQEHEGEAVVETDDEEEDVENESVADLKKQLAALKKQQERKEREREQQQRQQREQHKREQEQQQRHLQEEREQHKRELAKAQRHAAHAERARQLAEEKKLAEHNEEEEKEEEKDDDEEYYQSETVQKYVILCQGKREVDLRWNQIGVEGAKSLAKALETNTAVTGVSLSNNKIGDEGAKALAKALEKNTTVTKVWLQTNKIGAAKDRLRALPRVRSGQLIMRL